MESLEESIIRFTYNPDDNLKRLIHENIANYDLDYLCGIMFKEDANLLSHCSLYLVCNCKFLNGNTFYFDPICIVAKNETNAVNTYNLYTGSTNSTVMCSIYDRCDDKKLKIIPVV